MAPAQATLAVLAALTALALASGTQEPGAPPGVELGWRDNPTWLWGRVASAVLNPAGADRDTATVEVEAVPAAADSGTQAHDGTPVLIGSRGSRLLYAHRPHPTAPLLVIPGLLTPEECDQLIEQGDEAQQEMDGVPTWCVSEAVHTALRKSGMSHVMDDSVSQITADGLVCLRGADVEQEALKRISVDATVIIASDGMSPLADRAAGWLSHALALSGFHAGPSQLWRGEATRHPEDPADDVNLCTSSFPFVANPEALTSVVSHIFLTGTPPGAPPHALTFPHLDVDIAAVPGTAVIWSTLKIPSWPTPSVGKVAPAIGTCDPAMATATVGGAPLPTTVASVQGSTPAPRVLQRHYSSTPALEITAPIRERVTCYAATSCVRHTLLATERTAQRLIYEADVYQRRQRRAAAEASAKTQHTMVPPETPQGAPQADISESRRQRRRRVYQDDTLKQMQELLQRYVKAYTAARGSLRASTLVAFQLARTGRLDQAANMWQHVMGRMPYSARARSAIASIEIAQSKYDSAMEHLQTALLLSPRDVDIVMQIAFVHERRGELRAALARVEQAQRLTGDSPTAAGRIAHEMHRLAQKVGRRRASPQSQETTGPQSQGDAP